MVGNKVDHSNDKNSFWLALFAQLFWTAFMIIAVIGTYVTGRTIGVLLLNLITVRRLM